MKTRAVKRIEDKNDRVERAVELRAQAHAARMQAGRAHDMRVKLNRIMERSPVDDLINKAVSSWEQLQSANRCVQGLVESAERYAKHLSRKYSSRVQVQDLVRTREGREAPRAPHTHQKDKGPKGPKNGWALLLEARRNAC